MLSPREDLNTWLLEATDALADASRDGDWGRVFEILDDRDSFSVEANSWRRGGTSWFSPLHQAAWHGASAEVVEGLKRRGAWLTLRDAEGRRPIDIARERGAHHLQGVLAPPASTALYDERLAGMTAALAELVTADATRIGCTAPIRHLDAACIAEAGTTVWFSIPGMYGGFSIEMFRGRLHVDSWSRVVGGSGRAYVITGDRTTLVDEGFV
ncbi:MAG: hypothetical protein DI566_01070 [Microbacterium sp.]|nr:MAG: hypothetical protein DI566_01070 [Microbacterium sp.]